MRQRLSVWVLIVFLFGVSPVLSSTQSEQLGTCDNLHEWLATPIPPHLIAFLCSIIEDTNPIGVQQNTNSPLQDEELASESTTEGSTLPEEVRQQLLLLLALWSRR